MEPKELTLLQNFQLPDVQYLCLSNIKVRSVYIICYFDKQNNYGQF